MRMWTDFDRACPVYLVIDEVLSWLIQGDNYLVNQQSKSLLNEIFPPNQLFSFDDYM